VLDVYAHYAYSDDESGVRPEEERRECRQARCALAAGDGVLHDPLAITIEGTSALDEKRWITDGANTLGSLMVVVWTEREEEIRLISVRPATPKERKSYEKGT
jgi:uncharacterized DUF497 family protein